MSMRLRRLLTAWFATGALVLKAAVPLFAAFAAQLQGVPVAEVCSLYGVATSPSQHAAHHGDHHHHHGADAHEHGGSHSAADHGRDHCALTAVVAMAVGQTSAASPRSSDAVGSLPPRGGDSAACDECARWVARLAHGPPAPFADS